MRILKYLFFALAINLLFLMPAFAVTFVSDIQTGTLKQNSILTSHFRIEFSDLIMNQVDSDGDGIANVIETVADAAEESWDIIIDDLDYREPTSDTGNRLVVILDEREEYLYSGAIGVTSVLSNGDPYVAIDPWINDDYLQITMAHEFFHAVQLGYDTGFSTTYQGINWAEATGVWIEDIVYDSINDYVNYLPDYFDYPDYSVFASIVPFGSLYEYALNIWPRFLSEYYGDDIVKAVWETYFDSSRDYYDDLKIYEAVEDVVDDEGDTLWTAYREFSIWNLDISNYEEGSTYPDILMLTDLVQGDYALIDESYAPALFGTNYLYFENDDGEDSFYFHIIKGEGVSYSISLVPMDGDDPDVANMESVFLDHDEDLESEIVLSNVSSADAVVAIVSPLDMDFVGTNNWEAFDEGHLYYYLAQYGASIEEEISQEEEQLEEEIGGQSSEEKEGEVFGEDGGVRAPDTLNLSILDYDEDSVTFSWNRLSDDDIAGYELWYGSDEGYYTDWKSIDKAHTTFTTITGLEEGVLYYFSLYAIDDWGYDVGEPSQELTVIPTAWIFTDVSFFDEHYDAIQYLVDEGIFEGYSDGSFKAQNTINRAELLKILVEGIAGFTPDEASYRNCFPDVRNEWYAKYVCYAKSRGWIKGYPDGSFRPGNTVNKVEALKMLFNVAGEGLTEGVTVSSLKYPDADPSAWYAIYVWKASVLGILTETPGFSFNPDHGRNRGDMAEELFRYLVVSE